MPDKEKFEEVEYDGEDRCLKCACGVDFFTADFDCLADEWGMPACECRLDNKKVYFKKLP
jgi:hypothetical protein